MSMDVQRNVEYKSLCVVCLCVCVFSYRKEDTAICNNMGKPRGHFAKGDKTNIGEIKDCMISLICDTKYQVHKNGVARMVVTVAREKEQGDADKVIQSCSDVERTNLGSDVQPK